jgi:hypothetical protein
MLEDNYSYDSKQDVFNTKSQIEATTRVFVASHVWLDELRRSMAQSGNANNYRYLFNVGIRVFSEVSMGKDEGDANAGFIKSLIV